MYRKDISKSQVDEIIADLGFEPEIRAEQIEVPSLVRLGNRFFAAVTGKEIDEGVPPSSEDGTPSSDS